MTHNVNVAGDHSHIAIQTHEEAEELSTTITCTTTCTLAVIEDPLIPVDKFSSFNLYKRVTAWIIRFIHNCKLRVQATKPKSGPLTTDELNLATNYWCSIIQRTHFPDKLRILTTKSQKVPASKQDLLSQPICWWPWDAESVGDNKRPASPTTANIRSYSMVGNFCGYKFFAKQAEIRVSEIFAVLIFVVCESGTRGLASITAKSWVYV